MERRAGFLAIALPEPMIHGQLPGFPEGDVASKYCGLLELGRGGAANVFLAVARGKNGFNKLVVVKVPNPTVASDPELLELFLVEARLAARLNHANIVQTNEIAEAGSRPMIVMEYLEGQPLSSLIERAGGALSLPMHLRIISEVLSGLHQTHECADFDGVRLDVVHRDMTPHNVFVTYDGQVKILDFGIAKVPGWGQKTETGVVKGKLRYMPAEQIAGEAVDRRADIYAVGIMLWEAAAQQPIFRGQSERQILHQVLGGEIPSPRELNPDVPPELERLCMKALSPDREDRHATALELQADLERLLEHEGGTVTARELGRFVAAQFAEQREAVRKTIESRLADILKRSDEPCEITAGGGASATARLEPVVVAPGGRSAGRGRRGALLGAAVLMAAMIFTWALSRRDPDGAQASTEVVPGPSAPSSAPTLPSAAPAPSPDPSSVATIRVRIRATPQSAVLTLDRARLPTNPFSQDVPRDGQVHELVVTAPGYAAVNRSVTFDREIDIDLALKPLPTRPKPSTSKPSCNPPYVIDATGFKRYTPGCF
jgi:serine/threonine-protein kinase